jgi:hypothetical protein
LPSTASLTTADPYANLAVLYQVDKVAAADSFFGIYTRDEIEIVDGYAVFQTNHFGTYQAVFTKAPVAARKEVATSAVAKPQPTPTPKPTPTPPPPAPMRRVFWSSGALTATFGGDEQTQDGLQSFPVDATPARVGTKSTLTHGFKTKLESGD